MKKVAYVVNHLAFFDSHILPLALKAKQKYIVKIFCFQGGSEKMETLATRNIKKKNIKFYKFNSSPNNLNIVSEFLQSIKLAKEIKKFNPDIVHSISMKAIFLSLLSHFFLKINNHICFITGMGFFSVHKLNLYQFFLKFFLFKYFKYIAINKKIKIVVENNSDYNYFVKKLSIPKNQIFLINGVGVDLKIFKYKKKLKKKIILFSGRLIKEKGIEDFVNASKMLTSKFSRWKFIILGTFDHFKINSLKFNFNAIMKEFPKIIFLGYKKKVTSFFNKSSIVCLPSYREGFSKTLIEAASSGCAIVTTNVPGCRDTIINGRTGLLCEKGNYKDLARKLEQLITNRKKLHFFARNARKYAKKKFDYKIFINKNLKLYEQ